MAARLSEAIVALRVRIFERVNGTEGVPIPGPLVGVEHFRRVYAHPAADGRSRGAGLSDLFWYWLAPGPHVHQEHLEPGPRYEAAARTTRRFLARPKADIAELTERCAARVLDEIGPLTSAVVRLRDLMMPIWAEVYYELVFGEPCPRAARDLIVGNANDVITSLKCCGVRHMRRRERLTAYLRENLDRTVQPLPDGFGRDERAWYLQGAFFNTAIVQMSEAMTHLLLAIAQHPRVQHRLATEPDDDAYADRVLEESLRRWPLFGIAHRITSQDIEVDGRTLPKGSVLCFNYPAFHAEGLEDAETFDPDRWSGIRARDINHIPFGVTANRPCPARGVAPLTMRVVLREVLRRYALASSVGHTRSIPHRGPCLLSARSDPPAPERLARALTAMRRRERIEDVTRGLTQLVLGTAMVVDARRRRLAQRYFERQGLERQGADR